MKDEQFQDRIDAVKRIIDRFDTAEAADEGDEEHLTTEDADQLLEDGLDYLAAAKELLSLGSGTVMVVGGEGDEVVTERFDPLDE